MAAEPVTGTGKPRALAGNSQAESHVRAQPNGASRAERRVVEYLRALGLSDPTYVEIWARELTRAIDDSDVEQQARCAVKLTQQRFSAWLLALFGGTTPDPLWLRAFLATHPSAFLNHDQAARDCVRRFGDPACGELPTRAQFSRQRLERWRLPNWLLGLLPIVALTLGATALLLAALSDGGLAGVELVWTLLFSFLFGVTASGAVTAARGFAHRSAAAAPPANATALPRTALVMPIYHESAEQVFAALAAMREQLLEQAGAESFEVFVLSDSRDPNSAAEEERAFRRVSAAAGASIPFFYRRRARNTQQKAGNLAEFFERWGHRYTYAVILDADSLMTGKSLVELVSRMNAEPRVALLQAPIELHGGQTLLARCLQFASSVSGPVFMRGLSAWSGSHGNYYGHNAIVRVKAFLECCALPKLAGEPPLGGHILSHDFVEAALLCRAGWEVRSVPELAGSFEGLPPTLAEYVARDRRWCQGNLQHLRIACSNGLRGMSRIHLLQGAAAYLCGPAWLAFVLLGAWLTRAPTPDFTRVSLLVTLGTVALLLVPRLLGACDTLLDRQRRKAHGGALALCSSTLLEIALTSLLAPILMLHHARSVVAIVFGRTVRWGAQNRHVSGSLLGCLRAEWPTTLLGALVAALLLVGAPDLLAWLAPLWLPWLGAVPLAWLFSAKASGAVARRAGLLCVPVERNQPEISLRAEELRVLTASDGAARFRDLVLDPVLLAAHLTRLPRSAEGASDLQELCRRALRLGPAGLTATERERLTQDAASMQRLHCEAWQEWPVEAWEVSRQRPQLPDDDVASSPASA